MSDPKPDGELVSDLLVRLAKSRDERMKLQAHNHRDKVVKTRGRHSVTSCPPGSRAMCDYAKWL